MAVSGSVSPVGQEESTTLCSLDSLSLTPYTLLSDSPTLPASSPLSVCVWVKYMWCITHTQRRAEGEIENVRASMRKRDKLSLIHI